METVNVKRNDITADYCELIVRSCCICGEPTANMEEQFCIGCKNVIRRLKKDYELLDKYIEEREKGK